MGQLVAGAAGRNPWQLPECGRSAAGGSFGREKDRSQIRARPGNPTPPGRSGLRWPSSVTVMVTLTWCESQGHVPVHERAEACGAEMQHRCCRGCSSSVGGALRLDPQLV
jgi:hypothetical protein